MQQARPGLLRQKQKPSEKLLLTTGSSDSIKEAAPTLLEGLQKKHPKMKSFNHVRLSVITHWVGHYNIRQAQYMTGHNSIGSTQRYLKVNLQDLQEQLSKYHPLN
jgi:integrase/recombinase XerD